jgi:hypothetical protein
MEQLNEEFREILSLVAQLREGAMPPGRFSQLNKLLSTSPTAREYYTEIIRLYADLETLFKQNQ